MESILPRANSSSLAILLALTCWCLATRPAASLRNLRIQVNNENLQSPPYLLDAIERGGPQSGSPAPLAAQSTVSAPAVTPGADKSASNEALTSSLVVAGDENEARGSSDDHSMALIREETIEEMLDLEPDSVLKLSPSNLIESVDSHELAGALADTGAAQLGPAAQVDRATSQADPANNHNARLKSQLPVTSSHLKRPLIREPNDDQERNDESSAGAASVSGSQQLTDLSLDHPTNSQTPNGNSAGAKSRVSPSVASDQKGGSSQDPESLEKKKALLPPDTWEPNQVMAGVTNASHVPATVRRQYGHQTRTRITLGGGYQRNKLSPLADPNSSDHVDNRPEKPLAPLERPVRGQESQAASRVIEVPERIVLPASVFRQQQQQQPHVSASRPVPQANATSIVRKRDSRCPSNGVTALEHPAACDKYFLCEDGYSSERTCPNGLMYGTRDVVRDNFCVHRWQVVCGDKSMPNPISSPGCRWQNGIFNVQGSPKCTPDFYECTDGVFEVKKCSLSGQVYDDKTKSCQFAEQVGCAQEALAEFRCPADDQTNTYWPFPRYFLNERALIHCVNDKPEIIRCRDHERVDPENLFCVPIEKAAMGAADTDAGVEITERRTPALAASALKNQRERGKKVKVTVPVEDDHSNE